jgi:hypothetical protein
MDFVPIYSGYACIRRYIWARNTKAVRLDEKMARRGNRDTRTTPFVSVVLSYIIAVVMSSASGRLSF